MKPVKISEIGKVITGKTPKTSVNSHFGGDIPFITPSDMDGRKTIDHTVRYLSDEGAQTVKNCVIPAGTIMVSCIGSDMGKTYIAGRRSVTNQQINSIVVDERYFSPRFIYYNLFGRRPEIKNLAAGSSAQPILNKSNFSDLDILCPALGEQHEIGSILNALDEKIELNRRMSATLEEMARSLYRSWFVDFDPVQAKLEGRSPAHMDPATAALFPDSFGENGLPEGWEKVSVYDACRVQYGAPFKSKLFNTERDGRPLVRIRDLKNNAAGVFTTEVNKKEYLIQPGDTVVGMDGDFTPYTWCAEPSLMNQRVCAFLPIDEINRAFIRYAVPSLLKAEENAAVATTVIHLGKKDIDTFEIISAGDEVAKAFGSVVNPMVEKIVQVGLESQTLATLRDTLLPKLMSGELRVGEAREQLEDAV